MIVFRKFHSNCFSLILVIIIIYRGLPSCTISEKEIKGSTLLMFSPEDIKYELEELSVEDRIHLRNILWEIVCLWNDVFTYRANFALFFIFVLPQSYENLEPCCLLCINLWFLVLLCFSFYLFVGSSRRNQMILSLLGQGLYQDLRLHQVLAPEVRLLIQCTWDLSHMFLATFHRQRRALMSYQTATLRVTISKCMKPFQK